MKKNGLHRQFLIPSCEVYLFYDLSVYYEKARAVGKKTTVCINRCLHDNS